MSSWNSYGSPGLGNVGSYLISGNPFLTSSNNLKGTNPNNGEIRITYPYVARSVTIVNTGAEPLYCHFASRANAAVVAKGYYFELAASGDAVAFNCKSTEIYISMKNAVVGPGKFSLIGELTNIPAESMGQLSGSGINA